MLLSETLPFQTQWLEYGSSHMKILLLFMQIYANFVNNIEQVLAATPHKAPTIRTLASHHENYPS